MLNEDNSGRHILNGDSKLLERTILEFQKNPKLRQRMGENGYNAIKNCYSLERSAEKHESLFKEMEKVH